MSFNKHSPAYLHSMNSCPLARSTGNIPLADEWDITLYPLIGSSKFRDFLPITVTKTCHVWFSHTKSNHKHSKEFEVYFPHQNLVLY